MAKKKHGKVATKKDTKNTQVAVSQEDTVQIGEVFGQYHQIAQQLRQTTEQKQAEAALETITILPEGTQLALLKVLAKERHIDAADLLTAIHTLSPVKDVRKEARRALLQLESAHIYPQWKPPIQQLVALQSTSEILHFWRGSVADMLSSGVAHLVLCWEQENGEIRVLGFLLDFSHAGIKDFFSQVMSKRRVEHLIETESAEIGVPVRDCSLAEGRRMILDALEVNQRYGTRPFAEYRHNQSLVQRLVLDVPGLEEVPSFLDKVGLLDEFGEEDFDDDEFEDEELDLQRLAPLEVVTTFVASWINGKFETAYALLANNSPLREKLSQDEWVERRKAWAAETKPEELEPGYVLEREAKKPDLWLPRGLARPRTPVYKEIEAAWSVEINDADVTETLPELSTATAIYQETQRHWYWATYRLAQEQEAWRIYDIVDEVAKMRDMSVEELHRKLSELDTSFQTLTKKRSTQKLPQSELEVHTTKIFANVFQTTVCIDALIQQAAAGPDLYSGAAGGMMLLQQMEHALVYLEPLAEQEEQLEQRAKYLRTVAAAQSQLAGQFREEGTNARATHFLHLAETTLKESLALVDAFETHISLGEVLIHDERLDEAEEHFLKAQSLTADPPEVAHIEMHLGEIATKRGLYEEALHHYQRETELTPDTVDAWTDLAEAYANLHNLNKAETCYRHAMELDPDDNDLPLNLCRMYYEHDNLEKAIAVAKDMLRKYPDDANLNFFLATTYMHMGNYDLSEHFLNETERVAPQEEILPMAREILAALRSTAALSDEKPSTDVGKLHQPGQKRKKGR